MIQRRSQSKDAFSSPRGANGRNSSGERKATTRRYGKGSGKENREDRPGTGRRTDRYGNREGSSREDGNRNFKNRGYGNREYGNREFPDSESVGRYGQERRRTYERKTFNKAAAARTARIADESDGIRLNKFIANSGICSRREADEYIKAGLVSVNGVIVTEMGIKIKPEDDVRFNGERIRGEEKVYILMNKPKDVVTTTSDPHAERTVIDLVRSKCKERVFPVGRLDKSTTGVLLLTNDGDLAETLTHPSFEKKKIYHVFLDKNLKYNDLQAILNGITLSDGRISADSISYIDGDNSQVGIEIHSGKNRIIRRIFEHLGYKVKKLDRVYFAGLTKRKLRRGEWRYLSDNEVNMLKMGAFE